MPLTIHLSNDPGGNVLFYYLGFQYLLAHGYSLVIEGVCNSACTLTLMFPPERICATPRAVMAFHQASGGPKSMGTAMLWAAYPEALRGRLGSLGSRIVTMGWLQLREFIRPC